MYLAHQQERLADALVGRPFVLHHLRVHHLRDVVDEHHHLLLQVHARVVAVEDAVSLKGGVATSLNGDASKLVVDIDLHATLEAVVDIDLHATLDAGVDVVALEQELGGSGDADVHSAGHGVGKAIVALEEALALVEDVEVGLVAAVLLQSAHQLLRANREC